MERRIHALEVEFGDGLKRFDDAVQINRHLSELFIGEPDARIRGNVTHVAFCELLSHATSLSFSIRFSTGDLPAVSQSELYENITFV